MLKIDNMLYLQYILILNGFSFFCFFCFTFGDFICFCNAIFLHFRMQDNLIIVIGGTRKIFKTMEVHLSPTNPSRSIKFYFYIKTNTADSVDIYLMIIKSLEISQQEI